MQWAGGIGSNEVIAGKISRVGLPTSERGSQPRFVSLIIACAFFMHSLDSTIVATALPRIAETFHTSPVRLSIAITAYIVSLAVFIPMTWLATRRMFGVER